MVVLPMFSTLCRTCALLKIKFETWNNRLEKTIVMSGHSLWFGEETVLGIHKIRPGLTMPQSIMVYWNVVYWSDRNYPVWYIINKIATSWHWLQYWTCPGSTLLFVMSESPPTRFFLMTLANMLYFKYHKIHHALLSVWQNIYIVEPCYFNLGVYALIATQNWSKHVGLYSTITFLSSGGTISSKNSRVSIVWNCEDYFNKP